MPALDILLTHLDERNAKGLSGVDLHDFESTGRGLRALRPFKKGDTVLVIPESLLWTLAAAHADPTYSKAISTLNPPLSDDDTLALYILFVKCSPSADSLRRAHVELLPKEYDATLFFSEDQ